MAVPTTRRLSDLERLDAARIRLELGESQARRIERLEVLETVDSTNTHLLHGNPPAPGRAHLCLAEFQSAGRGRQGRTWIAPAGSGITLSIGWRFEGARGPAYRGPAGLSLAAGVAILRALERIGALGARLKWPNDVWLADRKLGGVLVELQGAAHALHAVIGVGLNVLLDEETRRGLAAAGTQAAAVADACREVPSRNRLAGALIDALIAMLVQFEREGFEAFHADWSLNDALKDRPARIAAGERSLSGRARGVDAEGALLLDTGEAIHRVVSGEASLRLAECDT
jgi:BirA family biotin operon repressor/biotin-[acetyl-CoA-carboxylase] ligase